MALDGRVVGEAPDLKAFRVLDVGDSRFGGDSTGLGFDSLTIE